VNDKQAKKNTGLADVGQAGGGVRGDLDHHTVDLV